MTAQFNKQIQILTAAYLSQNKATLAQIVAIYIAPAYLQSRNNQSVHKVYYCSSLQVSLNAEYLWRILKSSVMRIFQSTKRNVLYQKSRIFINTAARTSNLALSRKGVGVCGLKWVLKISCKTFPFVTGQLIKRFAAPVRFPNQGFAKNCGTRVQKFWNFYLMWKNRNILKKNREKMFQFFWHTYKLFTKKKD